MCDAALDMSSFCRRADGETSVPILNSAVHAFPMAALSCTCKPMEVQEPATTKRPGNKIVLAAGVHEDDAGPARPGMRKQALHRRGTTAQAQRRIPLLATHSHNHSCAGSEPTCARGRARNTLLASMSWTIIVPRRAGAPCPDPRWQCPDCRDTCAFLNRCSGCGRSLGMLQSQVLLVVESTATRLGTPKELALRTSPDQRPCTKARAQEASAWRATLQGASWLML